MARRSSFERCHLPRMDLDRYRHSSIRRSHQLCGCGSQLQNQQRRARRPSIPAFQDSTRPAGPWCAVRGPEKLPKETLRGAASLLVIMAPQALVMYRIRDFGAKHGHPPHRLDRTDHSGACSRAGGVRGSGQFFWQPSSLGTYNGPQVRCIPTSNGGRETAVLSEHEHTQIHRGASVHL